MPVTRKVCKVCRRRVGTYNTGTLRPHIDKRGQWCKGFGVRLTVAQVRPLVAELGASAAAKRLGTSHHTLKRRFGDKPWWPSRNRRWRYTHDGHPGRAYDKDCSGCIARRRDRYENSEEGKARAARKAARAEAKAAAEARAIAERETLEADRAYVAAMVASGQALNMRRALGVNARTVEEAVGLGRTALNKIENGRRPAMARVKAHATGYAAILREWERLCAERGIDPTQPQPKINRRRGTTQRAA